MTNQDNTDFKAATAKNIRAVLIFLGILNAVMAIVIPVFILKGGGYHHVGLVLLVLLALWDYRGFRMVRTLSKGDTSFGLPPPLTL